MDSSIMQNPSDPDATFRSKAGKDHRGYAVNITETVEENGSIISDYQYDVNTHSDPEFIKEYLEDLPEQKETMVLIADGAYDSAEIKKLAPRKNVGVLTTGLSGRTPNEILGDFTFSEDGKEVITCPNGNVPKSNSYIQQSGNISISFDKEKCLNCPFKEKCNPDIKVRTACKFVSKKSSDRVNQIRERQNDDVYQFAGRIRNGVETIPSIMRSKYNVDRMPVRGILRTKQFFGFKVAASNFTKLFRYTKGIEKCISLQ